MGSRFLVAAIVFSNALLGQTRIMDELIYQLRNPETGIAQFRFTLEKVGEYIALEVLEEIAHEQVSVRTLTGADATHNLVTEDPVLVTILRAGLPLNQGVQKVFPHSEVGFIAMSRDEETLKSKVEYIGIPDLKERTVIITDTMLATAGSLLDAIQIIQTYLPKKIFVITAIASKPGVEKLTSLHPNIQLFAGVVDPSLNEKGYIVPGLGDAGDRSFGKKCTR